MDVAEEKNTGEILETVLSMQKIHDVQVSEINCWQENDEELQREEQVIWQIEANDSNRPSVLETNTSSILHHLPITYLTTDTQNVVLSKARKPLTYIVSQNISESQKSLKGGKSPDVFLQDPQEVVVVSPGDSTFDDSTASYNNMGQMTVNYVDTKVYKVDNCSAAHVYFSAQDADCLKSEAKYQSIGGNIEGAVGVHELNELSNADQVKNLNISGEITLNKTDNLESVKRQRKVKKGNLFQSCDKEILDDKVKNSGTTENKIKKTGRSRIEKKFLNKKNKLSKGTEFMKNKLKCTKKLGKLNESKLKNDTNADSSDEKKDKNKLKEKRNHDELTQLEERAEQVAERFKIGCECVDYNCFEGLNPEKVFRHRLNIADLTKAEHDMYLMGVIMTSMQNPDETSRHKERLRIRSTYVYQGKRVCLTAFLYLEHVTLYQMKRLRKHLKYHGVSPRIHGNRGRKPANTLSLDTYQHATLFVQRYIEKHYVKSVPTFTRFSSDKIGSQFMSGTNLNLHDVKKSGKEPHTIKIPNKMNSYHLPPDCTKKTLHDEYKAFCEGIRPNHKIMQYSTFTSFLKKQFPNVKFQKMDKKQEERLQPEAKFINCQTQGEKSKPKMKKSKKKVEKLVVKDGSTQSVQTEDREQPPKIILPSAAIEISPSQLNASPKPNVQPVAKCQIISNTVIKAPQIVINGQHMQICGPQNQVESDVRLGEHFLVSNQLVNVSHAPTYTQRVYRMQNISNI